MTEEMFSEITTQDKLACVKRELKMRQKVYPRWQASGNMTPEKAQWELKVMAAIVADYEERLRGEKLQ